MLRLSMVSPDRYALFLFYTLMALTRAWPCRGVSAAGGVSAANVLRVWKFTESPDAPARQLQGKFVRVAGLETPLTKSYVVLDLADGHRRGFLLNGFSAEDKAFIQQLAQAQSATPPTDTATYASHFDEYKADDPNIHTQETQHFLFYWGNKITPEAKNWANPDFREMNFKYFEQVWAYFADVLKAPMPYAHDAAKFKTNVYITGTGLAKHPDGFAFGGIAIVIHPGAMLAGSTVIPHEFGHTLQLHSGGFRDNPNVGWFWECHANWGSQQFAPSYPPALDVYAERMHYELESSRMNYGSWPFLECLTEDLRFGSHFCYDIWTHAARAGNGAATETPFQTIMRLGVERGVFTGSGVEGFGDIIGQMAARNVTWDYIYQSSYQNYLNPIFRDSQRPSWERALLRPVPDRPGWFKPFYSQAPREYGINIVDLALTPGARRVAVNFDGIADEIEGSDWRLTLVAIDKAGQARYSPMWHNGEGAMTLRPDETRLALAIAAAPTIYKVQPFRPGYNVKRRHAYEVSFVGCKPSSQMPHPPTYAAVPGAAHPNGGGFVATTAHVDATAYVAPDAKVLGHAQVTGNARIEERALVVDDAKVSGNAIVGGHALVRGRAQVSGDARVRDYALVEAAATITDAARVLEYVRIHGDGSIGGNALVKGFGDVFTAADTSIGGTTFMGEDLEVYVGGIKQPINYGLIYGFNTADQLKNDRHDYGGLTAHWDFDTLRRRVLKDAFADNDGVLRGGAQLTRSDGRGVLRLNGKGQYALVEGSAVDCRDISFEAQLRWAGGGAEQRVFEFGGVPGRLWFSPQDETGQAAFVIKVGDQQQTLHATHALPQHQWVRVAITLRDGVATIAFDGQEVGHAPMTLKPEDIQDGRPTEYPRPSWGTLGADLHGGHCFNGDLDDLAISRVPA